MSGAVYGTASSLDVSVPFEKTLYFNIALLSPKMKRTLSLSCSRILSSQNELSIYEAEILLSKRKTWIGIVLGS